MPPTVHLNSLTAPILVDLMIIKKVVEEDEKLKNYGGVANERRRQIE